MRSSIRALAVKCFVTKHLSHRANVAPAVLKGTARHRSSEACTLGGITRPAGRARGSVDTRDATYMKVKRKAAAAATQEPIGIVISRGPEREKPPAFFAYVWAPAPEKPDEPTESKVA